MPELSPESLTHTLRPGLTTGPSTGRVSFWTIVDQTDPALFEGRSDALRLAA